MPVWDRNGVRLAGAGVLFRIGGTVYNDDRPSTLSQTVQFTAEIGGLAEFFDWSGEMYQFDSPVLTEPNGVVRATFERMI